MKRMLSSVVLGVLFSVQVTMAREFVGTVSCVGSEDSALQVTGQIYGTESGFEFADLILTIGEKKIKSWSKVPYVDRGFSFSALFKDERVELHAYYDDVGSISSLILEGKEVVLTCSI